MATHPAALSMMPLDEQWGWNRLYAHWEMKGGSTAWGWGWGGGWEMQEVGHQKTQSGDEEAKVS